MNHKPFTILVSIPLKPKRADEFLALLNDVFEAMKVEETFVNATALGSADDPDTIVLVETWLDRDNFMSVQCEFPVRLRDGSGRGLVGCAQGRRPEAWLHRRHIWKM